MKTGAGGPERTMAVGAGRQTAREGRAASSRGRTCPGAGWARRSGRGTRGWAATGDPAATTIKTVGRRQRGRACAVPRARVFDGGRMACAQPCRRERSVSKTHPGARHGTSPGGFMAAFCAALTCRASRAPIVRVRARTKAARPLQSRVEMKYKTKTWTHLRLAAHLRSFGVGHSEANKHSDNARF